MLRQSLPMGLAVLVLLASLAPVMADPVEPLVGRAQEKAAEAGEDPVGFAQDHTSEEGLSEEIVWTRDYACFAAREAAKESGQQPPDLSQLGCPEFEEVREEDDLGLEDPDEAAAQSLDEVDGVVSDARGTAHEITKDPENAAQAALGFIQRSVDAVGRILGGTVGVVKGIVDDVIMPANHAAADSAKTLTGLWYSLPLTATKGSIDQLVSLQQTTVQAIQGSVEGLADGVKSTGDAIAGAVGSVGDSVKKTLQGWFSAGDEAPEEQELDRPARDLERKADGLLPDLEDTLPEL